MDKGKLMFVSLLIFGLIFVGAVSAYFYFEIMTDNSISARVVYMENDQEISYKQNTSNNSSNESVMKKDK